MPSSEAQTTKEQLLKQLVDAMEEINSSGPYHISQDWFTLHLRMPHLRVLFLLLREGTLRMSDLASMLDVSVSGATGLVDRLVELGLVDRSPDPEDRRSVLCFATEGGRDLGYRLLAERRSRWEERLAPLSPGDMKKVMKALKLVLDAIHQAAPESEAVHVGTGTLNR